MKVNLIIRTLILNSQELGSDNEHMTSRISFTLETSTINHDYSANIKQTVGSSYNENAFEVYLPKEIQNYEQISKKLADYYKECVGPQGKIFRISSDSKNISLKNCEFQYEQSYVLDINAQNPTW